MADKICFGMYELDRDARELRKRGTLIRLQDQPFRVLAILASRPDEIITREELQGEIWGKETFVDFDQSLNKAVNRIREALDDDAGSPRYIETIPRRGYRFIAPVEGGKNSSPPPQGLADIAAPSRFRWKIPVIAMAAILPASLILGAWLALPPSPPRIVKSNRLTFDGSPKCCLVTDGSQVYFSEGDPITNSYRLKHLPVTGGDPSEIQVVAPKGGLLVNDISPNHDRLLVAAEISGVEASLWSVSLGGPRLPVP